VETKKVLDAGPVLARLHKVIREAGIIDLTGWGEPFLIHKFDEVLRHLVDLNTFQRFLFITTNGSLLNARHAEILRGRINSFIVSFHAASEAMFNKIVTGTSFVKTLHSIEKFVKAVDEEDRRRITLHFVASTINYGEIVDYVKMASNIGVRNVRIGNVYTTRDNLGISLLSIKDAYNSVINEAEAVGKELGVGFAARKFGEKIKKSKYDYVRCSWPFDNCFIDMDGNLSVCCWISEQFGNIFDDDFESVWFGEKLAQLRRSRSGNQNCKKCNIHIPFDNVDSHLLAGT
jgi:MoaA/NifB/PqqE/SkfB family radical SAM enzyme